MPSTISPGQAASPKKKKPKVDRPAQIRHDIARWFDLAGPEIAATAKGVLEPPDGKKGSRVVRAWQGVDPPPKPKAKPPGGGGAKTPKLTPAQLQQAEDAAIEANPFTQMGNELAAAQEQETNAALSYLSPAATASASAGAEAQALQDTGMKSSPWLSSEVAQGNANDSPITKAMAAYTAAYEATEPSIISADKSMGEANALAEQVAPASAYLNLASGHLGNTNYLQLDPEQAAGLPPALQYYLGNKGAGIQGVTSPGAKAQVPSVGAVLSGSTAQGNPAALSGGTGAAPG